MRSYHANGALAWSSDRAYHPNGALAWSGSRAYHANGQAAFSRHAGTAHAGLELAPGVLLMIHQDQLSLLVHGVPVVTQPL